MNKQDLVAGIQGNLLSSSTDQRPFLWSMNERHSYTWEGIILSVDPSSPYGGVLGYRQKKVLSVTIRLDKERHQPDVLNLLRGCQLILSAGATVWVGRLDSTIEAPVLGRVFCIQYEDVPANASVQLSLQAD